jgi:hypothetical protein
LDLEFIRELDCLAQKLRNGSRVVLSFWERQSVGDYCNICAYALYISKMIGRLPDNLHSRLVLGSVNHYVKEYFRVCDL